MQTPPRCCARCRARQGEQHHFARRHKIRQVLDCGVIGAGILQISLVKLALAVRVMAKPSPEAGARGDVLQPLVDACMLLRKLARPDAVDGHGSDDRAAQAQVESGVSRRAGAREIGLASAFETRSPRSV